jgi:hypothetical protein
VVADLQYAVDYLENSLVLLRSRANLQPDPSLLTRSLAYFEKASTRTAQLFATDLQSILDQTHETLKRLRDNADPYEGRYGDLRRAFYSAATRKLEPYRLYIPRVMEK